jgi:hypothetical protein
MEAILPLQTASVAFEVGKCIVQKARRAKFTEYFANKVIRPLEKSCISVCNSQKISDKSRYQKMHYELSSEVKNYLNDQFKSPVSILD